MSAVLKSVLAATDLGLDALSRGPRRYAPDPAADHEVANFQRQVQRDRTYRGAQYHQPLNGDEWLRRAELERAGQRDMFGE